MTYLRFECPLNQVNLLNCSKPKCQGTAKQRKYLVNMLNILSQQLWQQFPKTTPLIHRSKRWKAWVPKKVMYQLFYEFYVLFYVLKIDDIWAKLGDTRNRPWLRLTIRLKFNVRRTLTVTKNCEFSLIMRLINALDIAENDPMIKYYYIIWPEW